MLDWGLCYFYENAYVLFNFEKQKFISICLVDKMQFGVDGLGFFF